MNGPARYCFCSPGQPPWPARPADRYCGLCGRELLAVSACGPLVSAGPPPAVAVYLTSDGQSWTGRLRLEIPAVLSDRPQVRWRSRTHPPLRLSARLAAPGQLELTLQAADAGAPPRGPLGEGLLAVTLHGHPFRVRLAAFAVCGPPKARLTARLAQPRPGRVLILNRELPCVQSFLELHAGPGIPVQLEAVHCDHPAAAVNLLHPGRAQAPAVAEVRWDPARLGADDQEVLIRLQASDLPEVTLRQRVRRRSGRPVRFQPGALVVDCLAEDGPQTHLLRLTNESPRPVLVRGVESDAAWVAGAAFPSPLPLALPPGAGTTLRVDLHLHEVNGVPPPFEGHLALVLEGRPPQVYPVRVEEVRRPRRCAGPLLVDPGPPRVVLARWDEARRRVVFLRCSGDGGIDPRDLGLHRGRYAEAVYGRPPNGDLLNYLAAAARARCRIRDLLEFTAVHLFGHPWADDMAAAPGVEVCDWAALARICLGRQEPAPSLLRLDLWQAYLVEGSDRAEALLGQAEQRASVGAALVRWLARQCLDKLAARRRPAPAGLRAAAEGREAPETSWMRLTCEALVADYPWGPAYAWRRLLRAWRAALPVMRGVRLGVAAGHTELVRGLADYAQQVCLALARRGAGEGPGGLAVCGALTRSPLLRGVLKSIFTSAGFETEFVAAPWVAWLAPAGAVPEAADP